MEDTPRVRVLLLVACVLLVACPATPSHAAEEFRIETQVFVDDETKPAAETTTLFERDAVYDFTEHPAQVIVYRAAQAERTGQFILLDLDRRLRTDVPLLRINELLQKVADWAAVQDDPVLRFSARPEFSVDYNEQSGALSLTSEVWTYRVATAPAENASALARYRDFTDWYARLNSMLHNTPPPGPRLRLNEELEQRGRIPVEIHRTIAGVNSEVRAAHLFSLRLSREDRVRLDEVRKALASYEKVDNETYMAR